MFDFEKLTVYSKTKKVNLQIKKVILSIDSLEKKIKDQLRRASISIVLNIAERTSRFSDADKRNIYVIARGSLLECVAILDLLKDDVIISKEQYFELYNKGEELSKILYVLIRGLEKK